MDIDIKFVNIACAMGEQTCAGLKVRSCLTSCYYGFQEYARQQHIGSISRFSDGFVKKAFFSIGKKT